MFKSWKTSVLGIAALIASGLVLAGVFTPEDAELAKTAVAGMVEHLTALILGITGLIGLFTRDNDVSSESAGAK